MNVAIVLATVVLLIQGTRIVMRPGEPPFVRCFGLLTLLLAALSLVLFAILFWGEAVLSPEFDVVMARGHWRGLVALVIGFAVAAGLGLHVQRLKADLPGRLAGLLVLGFAVGTAAATRITRLGTGLSGEDSAQAFWIYSYDLWWPPLLIWVSACFLDGAITILGVHDRRVRTGAFLAMLVALSLRARSRQVFTDPNSALLWYLAFVVAALGCLLLVLWLAWSAPVRPVDAWRRLRAAARGSLPAMRRQWERAVTGGWPGISWQVWHWLQPMVGQLLAVLALAMIAASLGDIFYVGWLPHAGALVILAMAWTCLAEVTAQGPLRAFVVNVVPEVYARLANQGSWVRQAWLLLRGQLAGPLSRLGTALRRLVSLRPFPEALMKIGVLFVALVVAYEVPHAGKTVLQPFTALAVNVKKDAVEVPTVSPQADIGRAVFDYLINTLGALTAELQPDVILLLPPDPERGARFRTLAAGGSGSIDPFLTQTADLDIGVGVKVPLGLLLTPVLQPVRWALGVRVVNGSVLADPQGYTVLVRSSAGEMWRARLANKDVSREVSSGDDAASRSAPDRAFNRLALELAFRIMSAEPALATFGMTRSWDAFEEFKRGLESWQEFTLHRGLGDPGALSGAIRHFRAATAVDPAFALAHYRLGVALNNDGQPLAAAEALRASLKTNPGFVPAMVALASVLYSSEHDLGTPLIGVPKTRDDAMGTTRVQEARRLWQSVISVESGASSLDRAAAWAGLCRHALDDPERRHQASAQPEMHGQYDDTDSLSYRIAYFYCQQAERLYAALVATPREDLRVRTARAAEIASIGMLLERHGPKRWSRPTPKWQCSRATIDEDVLASDGRTVTHSVPVTYYTGAALKYYRQALKLLPDDSVLRCHEASAEFAASGDRELMRALESEAASRWNLADSYHHEARLHLARAANPVGRAGGGPRRKDPESRRDAALAAAYYGLALSEYQATQERDPTNVEALNRYAHVFWEWRHGEADETLPAGPGLAHARRAESNARKAIAMIEAKWVKPVGQASLGASPEMALNDPLDDSLPRHLRPAAATAYASLGAVLVAQTRPHEAIDVLGSAHRHLPEHPSFDHVRWMLAQAHLCAASTEFRAIRADYTHERRTDPTARWGEDSRLDAVGAHREKARRPLDIIRAHEQSRESPAFAGLMDISRSDRICRADWLSAATEREGRRLYTLRQIDGANYRRLCGWLGVGMKPPADWREEEVYLHVWGGRVDERVPVKGREQDQLEGRERPRRRDPIPITPRLNPFYYFAQLDDAAYLPVSLPVVLTQTSPASLPSLKATPGVAAIAAEPGNAAPRPGPESRCPDVKNLIQLTFDRIGSATARAVP
jgi:tetratricopeptide (TPR) repeat protein